MLPAVFALALPSTYHWVVGLVVGGLFLLLLLTLLGSPVAAPKMISSRPPPQAMRQQINSLLVHWPVIGHKRFFFWEDQLRLAAMPFYPAELYGVSAALAIVTAVLLTALLGYPLLAVFLGVVVAWMPFLLVRWRAQSNRRLLTLQIESMCLDLAGAAEGGASKMQLLEQAAESEPPLGFYFSEVLAERDQGVSSIDSLENLRSRVQHRQMEGLIQALQIHFERGAPIAPLLREAADDIRIEDELIVEIQTKLEQPRVQFWFVCLLSIPVLLYMRWEDPVAVDGLLGTTIGQIYYISLWIIALLLYLLVSRITRMERL